MIRVACMVDDPIDSRSESRAGRRRRIRIIKSSSKTNLHVADDFVVVDEEVSRGARLVERERARRYRCPCVVGIVADIGQIAGHADAVHRHLLHRQVVLRVATLVTGKALRGCSRVGAKDLRGRRMNARVSE